MIADYLSRSYIVGGRITHLAVRRIVLAACATWFTIAVSGELSVARAGAPEGAQRNLSQHDVSPRFQNDRPIATFYRRIFVPAGNVEAWPRAGEKYLPVESSDFEDWLMAANSAALEPSGIATIQEGRYVARLEGERLVDCHGEWSIAVRGNGPAFLPLGDTSLVVRDARWRDDRMRPARIGAWGSSGNPADTVGLEVPRSGALEFAWQAPSRAVHNGMEFDLRLPTAVVTRLDLDLPTGTKPVVKGGVVLTTYPPLAQTARVASTNRRRWELAMSPSSATTLRLIGARGAPTDNSLPLMLRDDMSYLFTHRGLIIEATWHLDGLTQDHRELTVPLPDDVSLVSAVLGKRELSWRIESDALSASKVAVIELPETNSQGTLQVVVSAWHPLVLDKPWELPSLRPRNVLWQSSDVELSIGSQLEIWSLSHRGYVQTGVSRSDNGAKEKEVMRLAKYSPTGELTVRISRRRPLATVRLGSSLALADPDINGRLVSEWNVSEGNLNKLSGELAPGWVIESVHTNPAEALGEWFIDARGKQRRLEIQLARAARPGRNVSVTITGRLQRVGIGEAILAKTMRMVDWADVRVAQHLLTFQTVEPYAIERSGELPVVAIESVSDDDRTRINLPSGKETVFNLASVGDKAGLKLALERGQYQADIRIEAAYVREKISQNYHLTIDPATNGVDHLLVYSTAALGDDVRWKEISLNATLSGERLPVDDPRWAGLPARGELWLVRLPGLTTRTVEIVATIVTPWPTRKQLPLLAMPEAIAQRGRVLVHAGMDSTPLLEPQGLQFIALPAASDESSKTDGQPPIRAAYRYDPATCLSEVRAAQLWMGPRAHSATSPLIARHVELESYFWPNGRATHRASYELMNEGAASFNLKLPDGAVVNAVLLDGRALEQPVGNPSGQLANIPLGTRAGSASVDVYFDLQQGPLAAGSKLQPPLVHHGIPILNGRWTIWLPEEFSTSGTTDLVLGRTFNWRRRLFGPLGRPSTEERFHPLRSRDWARLLGPLGSVSVRTAAAETGLLGWVPHRTSFIAAGPAAVSVAHPPAITTWAIAMFLICLAGGKRLQGRRTVYVALLAMAAMFALFLPASLAPIATGAVMGLLLSLVARWPRQAFDAGPAAQSWSRISTVTVPSIILATVVATRVLAEPASNSAASLGAGLPATIERVLIPVAADGRQVDSKLYLSERFFRTLMQPRADEALTNRRWVLLGAVYDGELRERAKETKIATGAWTIAFDIEILARDTTIVLPLVRTDATWRDTAMLDGVPVPVLWRDDGRGCAVEISEPGRYQLTLSCLPRTEVDRRRNRIRLAIPRLAGAHLRLDYPKSLIGLSVSGAEVATGTTEPFGRLELELDETGQLEVAWPSSTWTAGRTQSLRVTGMRWLRISTNEIGLEIKYVVEGSARRPEALVVAFDRRWKLVDNGSSLAEVGDEPDGRRSIRVPLPADDTERQEVTLQWRLTGTRALGQLLLPAIELISNTVTNRWLAISTDPAVECEIVGGSPSPGGANEFLAMWGNANDVPQLVIGNVQSAIPWSVSVGPRLIESAIDEVLHVAATRLSLSVAYQADVTPGTAHEYQFQVVVPAELSIDEVALSTSGRRVPVHWARVGKTRVNVFFSEQVTTKYRLVLQGTMPIAGNAPRPLPRVTAPAMASASQDVQLYRDVGVLVKVSGLSDANPLRVGSPEPPPATWIARPAGVYRLDNTAFHRARLRIAANDVQVRGSTLLMLNRESDVWFAGFHARLTVEAGELDRLKLKAPAAWAGPYNIESSQLAAVKLDMVDRPGSTLLIDFNESIAAGDSIELTVRGALTQLTQAPVALPDITSVPTIKGKRYLQVPSHLGGEPIAWTEAGVRPCDLPSEFREIPGIDVAARTFEVIEPSFRVTVKPPSLPRQSARVRLADTTIWSAGLDAQLIETRLVVAAPDLVECLVQLPQAQQLVSVRLDERRAIMQRLDARHWRVSVGPAQLPQMLEIVSIARGGIENNQKLQRPRILAQGKRIPVEVGLWSIEYPSISASPRVADADKLTAADQAAVRLDRLVGIVETATPAAVAVTAPDGYFWFRFWASRLTSLRGEAVRLMADSVQHSSLSQVSRPADEQLSRASERLDRWIERGNELLTWREPDGSEVPVEDDTGRLALLHERSPVSRWIHCVAEGSADELSVDLAPVTATSRQIRLVGSLAIIGAVAACMWVTRRPAVTDCLYRWPHAIAFLVGLAYWAWLWPSWVGILIVAVSLFLAGRLNWFGRSLPVERSTVVRISRSDVVDP